jgi:DNA repair exonuclease SbcCD nuclease subunit
MLHNKALITADLHLMFNQIYKKENGLLSINILDNLLKSVSELQPEYFFILGDIFHHKDTTSAALVTIFTQFIYAVAEKTKVIILIGNHDFSVTSVIGSNVKYYHPLQNITHPNITIVDDYFKLDEDNAFIPYCRSRDLFEKRLISVLPAKRLFTHIDLNGFALGDDYIEKNAYLTIEDLDPFEQVFSGHYHEPSQLKKLITTRYLELVYVGSPRTVTHSESDQEKRFILLDLTNGEWQSIPTNMTMHKTIKVDVNEPFPELNPTDVARGVNFRLWVTGTKEQIDLWLSRKPKDYPTKNIKSDFIVGDKKRIELKSTDSRSDIIEKYTEEELNRNYGGKDASQFDLKKLIELGKRFLNS